MRLQVKTLAPDGLVLEELISTMQSEYGTPSTPQEYRLIVKVPLAADAQGSAETGAGSGTAGPPQAEKAMDGAGPGRRRRRGRIQGPGAGEQ